MTSEFQEKLQTALKRFRPARNVIVFSGAGISQESGIDTFRGNGGLWGNYSIEQVATPEGFSENPKLVWDFYLERRKQALTVKPNPGHEAIASWQTQFSMVGVVTQNVDGLHAKAGSQKIKELHGSLWRVRCTQCAFKATDDSLGPGLPKCKQCGGLLRPDIVWFGEGLDSDVVADSVQWMRKADVIFVVGTSGVVEPAASFVRDAKDHGAFLIEINTAETALTLFANVSLFGKSGEILGKWFQ